jgi:hypothetical protein
MKITGADGVADAALSDSLLQPKSNYSNQSGRAPHLRHFRFFSISDGRRVTGEISTTPNLTPQQKSHLSVRPTRHRPTRPSLVPLRFWSASRLQLRPDHLQSESGLIEAQPSLFDLIYGHQYLQIQQAIPLNLTSVFFKLYSTPELWRIPSYSSLLPMPDVSAQRS